jgi:peroxiredoxin Q/BCP
MAATKKKSAPKKSIPKAKPNTKTPQASKAAKPAKAAKQGQVTRAPARTEKSAKPTKSRRAQPPIAKAVKTGAKALAKKASGGVGQAAKDKAAKAQSAAKSASKEASSLVTTVKRAAAKVARVAAAAAVKVLDADFGRTAPEFELRDEKGETVSSADLAGKPYLLYFYPKDDTPGCTKEACDIRDNFGRFGQRGLRVLGVSPDTVQSHAKFGKKYGLPFTLLADPDKKLASAYGVWGEKNNYGKKYMGIIRSSFLIGADGVIKKSYRGVKVDGHVDSVLQDAAAML